MTFVKREWLDYVRINIFDFFQAKEAGVLIKQADLHNSNNQASESM